MSTIAVLIAEGFEDSEYQEPAEAFAREGLRIVHIGLKADTEVAGKKGGLKVSIDKSVDDVSIHDFDALFIPGGHSPDNLRAHPGPVYFVRDFVQSGKPVFVICHGPQLLISAGVVRGRTITGWKSIAQDLKNAGANYVNQEVVEDGNIVSSRCPDDIPAFVQKSLEKLHALHVC